MFIWVIILIPYLERIFAFLIIQLNNSLSCQSPQWCKVTKTTLRPWTCALNCVSAVLPTNNRGRQRSDFQLHWNVRHAWLPLKSDFSRVSGWEAQLPSHLLGFPSSMGGLCLSELVGLPHVIGCVVRPSKLSPVQLRGFSKERPKIHFFPAGFCSFR